MGEDWTGHAGEKRSPAPVTSKIMFALQQEFLSWTDVSDLIGADVPPDSKKVNRLCQAALFCSLSHCLGFRADGKQVGQLCPPLSPRPPCRGFKDKCWIGSGMA